MGLVQFSNMLFLPEVCTQKHGTGHDTKKHDTKHGTELRTLLENISEKKNLLLEAL